MRIVEHEAGVDQRILPVQGHAVQEYHALRIDVHLNVFEGQDVIGSPRLRIELELIAESGAAAAEHAQAQSALYVLTLKSFANFLNRLGGHRNHSSVRADASARNARRVCLHLRQLATGSHALAADTDDF